MENVKTRSFLWNYLRSSALIRRGFHFYTKGRPLPHFFVRLDGTFESYLKKFSAKTRENRLREIRRLRERGQLNLLKVSQASESMPSWRLPTRSPKGLGSLGALVGA